MKKKVLVASVVIVALAVLLGGCSGGFAPTLPSPDGGGTGPLGQNTSYRVLVQGQEILNAPRTDFTFEERLVSGTDADFRPVQLTRFESTGQTTGAANVVLVLDRSGSMSIGTREADMKDAAKQWVSRMRSTDKSAVVVFDDQIDVLQGFTGDKSLLNDAIDQANARGLTAIWDGGEKGLDLLENLTAPGVKAILLLTDGVDNASSVSRDAFIARASRLGIPVFTIGFAISQGSIAEDDMKAVASGTGGDYVNAQDATALAAAFAKIQQTTQQGFYTVSWLSMLPSGEQGILRITYRKSTPPVVIEQQFTVVDPSQ